MTIYCDRPALSARNIELIESLVSSEAQSNPGRVRQNLRTVVENVYRRLLPGDYGRGDVRRHIESMLPPRVSE